MRMKGKHWKRRAPLSLMLVLALLVAALGLGVAPAGAATQTQINTAIDDGLQWLASQQNADGSWGSYYRIGRTGLAVLAFETDAVLQDLSPLDPAYPYDENVEDGLNYLFSRIPMYGSMVTAIWETEIFVRAIVIALFLGLLGGFYPALRATRLQPVEALRYE